MEVYPMPVNFQGLTNSDWISVISAAISAGALVTAWFVYRVSAKQQITAEFQINFALYQKRYEIYDVVICFIATILRNGTSSSQEIIGFHREMKEIKFLFGQDITSYIDILLKQADNLQTANRKLNYETEKQDSEAIADKRQEIFDWFGRQIEAVPNLFMTYLDFRNIAIKKDCK
jgi:hypothetical protein